MNLFELMIIIVTAGGIALAMTPWFRPSRVLSEMGRLGPFWFSHNEDEEIAVQPSEDAKDAPIVWRPLRGRQP
jgi:hypothetical protein